MNTRTSKNMYWLVKRELWEHRGGFFWAPVITGGIFLLLNIMGINVRPPALERGVRTRVAR